MVNAAYMHIGNHLTNDDDQNDPCVIIDLILFSISFIFFTALEGLT